MTDTLLIRPPQVGARVCLVLLAALLMLYPLALLSADDTVATAEQQPGAATADPTTTIDDSAENQREIERIQTSIRELREASINVPEDLSEQLELLKWQALLLTQRESNARRLEELRAELSEVRKETETLSATGLDDRHTHSFLDLDEARGLLSAAQDRSKSRQLEIDAVKAALTLKHEAFDAAERQRRLAQDELETAADAAARDRLTALHALAKLRSRVHGEALQQQQVALEVVELEHEISLARVEFLKMKVDRLRTAARFSQQDLDKKLAQLDEAEAGLRTQLAELQDASRDVEHQWLEATRSLDAAGDDEASVQEEIATYRLSRELYQERVAVLNQMLAYVGLVRTYWRRRYEVVNGEASVESVRQWCVELQSAREQVARYEQLIAIRTDERLNDLATLQKRLLALEEKDGDVRQWVAQQRTALEASVADYGSQLVLLKAGQRLIQSFSEEVDVTSGGATALEWLQQGRALMHAGWDYELANVDDKPITVSKVVRGILLLLVGFGLARLFSRTLCKWMLPRFGVNQSASLALQSITFYLMVTCCGFLALEFVNLPLTVFAFMGGAVAIGVGFGSQNVLNNFISGLILLAERPIRVGDLVDIDGLNGNVERIGARSTRVRTGSNLEIIVPNSKFLENNVTNWTLSNTLIRSMVSVGVAYGSPTREVSRLLRQAVTETDGVLEDPAPVIVFKEFGDNALLFEVHFWIHMQTIMQGESAASEVRHTIDDLLREANITIAFPQRDIHLDTTSPIEISLRHGDSRTTAMASALREAA